MGRRTFKRGGGIGRGQYFEQHGSAPQPPRPPRGASPAPPAPAQLTEPSEPAEPVKRADTCSAPQPDSATMSSRVLGIDFGTTNTVVAVVMEDGAVEVIPNDIGNRTTPSVVHIDPTDPSKHQVGEAALRLGVGEPQNTIRNVKRVLGFPPEAARCITALGPVKVLTSEHGDAVSLKLSGDTKTTPEEVVAMILLELKKAAEHHLGKTVSKAVIAVPSYFTAAQRQAVRDAAALADLEVVEIVNETTAAALAYAYDKESSKTAMIVDVGGGGCCISVVRVENNDVSVLACSARQPGGENFDAKMVDYLKKVVAEEHKKDVVETRSEEILRSQWVGAKIKLSRLPQTNIQTYLPEIETEFRKLLTQAEFNSECSDLFQHITTAINATLKRAQVEATELDDVILVGGSTRIVKLRELIIETVGGGVKLHKALNPDEVVAQGAALLGAKYVQIKKEVLGLNTCISILDSDKQETNERWSHSTTLPVSFAFRSLSMTNSKTLEMKQGHETRSLMTVCQLPIPLKAENITINAQGSFSFYDAGKNKISTYLRGCIPEVPLKSLKEKMQTHVKSSLAEAGRVEAKNALEDVLRQGKSWEISEDEPFPERYKNYMEMCREKLNWLEEYPHLGKEEFDNIRVEFEKNIASVQEDSKKERHRLHERGALTEILNTAINMEVVKDDFEEKATCLRKSCQEEKEWLLNNTHASSEEYTTRKNNVIQAIAALTEDRQKAAIRKRRDASRELLQQRLRGIQQFATQKKHEEDDLDQQWGTKLDTICRSVGMWLKNHPEAPEDELNLRTTQLEKDNIILDKEMQQLKQTRDCEMKAAFKNAEEAVLEGMNLKVTEFEAVSSDALNFVKMCEGHLEQLKKNPRMKASDCAKVSSEVENGLRNLRSLCMAEVTRRQRWKSLQSTLETALKDEPLRPFAQGFLTWLEQNPKAAKEQLEEVMVCVEVARRSLQEADKLVEAAMTKRGLATMSMERLGKRLGLQLSAAPASTPAPTTTPASAPAPTTTPASAPAPTTTPASAPALTITHASAPAPTTTPTLPIEVPVDQATRNGGYSPKDFTATTPSDTESMDTSPVELSEINGVVAQANGLPPAGRPAHPEVPHVVSQPLDAVQALKAAGEAGSMSLVLSRAAAGGREFVSLAVRYLEPSGHPVERLLVVREPGRDGELSGGVGQLLVESFLALCKEAGNVDWRSKLIGVSLVGSGVPKENFFEALNQRRRGEDPLKELDCGAVRLDQRLVLALQGRGARQQQSSPSASLRDFFCTIDSLRNLFCAGGRWFKVLQEQCRSLKPEEDPWLTYTSAVRFVSEERRKLGLALNNVVKMDPSLQIFAEAIEDNMCDSPDNPFGACLLICKELFHVVPCFEDNLLQQSDHIKDLYDALLKSSSFPKDSFKPKTRSRLKCDIIESQKIAEMCEDTTKMVLQQWRESWEPVLSLLDAIIHFLEDGDGGRGDHAAVTAGGAGPKTRGQTKATRDLLAEMKTFYGQFPERFTSLEAMMCGLPRERFAKEFPALHGELTLALTAPFLPPRGPRAQDQLRAGALRAATHPWAWAAGTHP